MPETNEGKIRTPTETLVDVMEDFSDHEPDNIIVIYTSGDNICWSRDSRCSASKSIGMMECVKNLLIKQFLKD